MNAQANEQSMLVNHLTRYLIKRGGPMETTVTSTGASSPIFYWRPRRSFRRPMIRHNVGDRLALELVERLLAGRGLTVARYTGGTRRLLSIGSVLHFAAVNDVIWGTGINGKLDSARLTAKPLDVRALRGPLTAAELHKHGIATSDVYGDPGILVSVAYPQQLNPQRDYWVVPHFREKWWRFVGHPTLSPAQAPTAFLRKLVRARLVISSSLHGIVLAESYGIPAIWLENQSGEHPFKYHDYYLGTGRSPPKVAVTVDEALRCEPPPPLAESVKERLLQAFPWDLWA